MTGPHTGLYCVTRSVDANNAACWAQRSKYDIAASLITFFFTDDAGVVAIAARWVMTKMPTSWTATIFAGALIAQSAWVVVDTQSKGLQITFWINYHFNALMLFSYELSLSYITDTVNGNIEQKILNTSETSRPHQ